MGIFPAGELMRELVLALGAALLVGNLAVVFREHWRRPEDLRPKPNMKIVVFNLAIGAVMTMWGVGSLIAGR